MNDFEKGVRDFAKEAGLDEQFVALVKKAIKVKEPPHWALRPLSGTLGRLTNSLMYGALLGRPDLSWKKWTPERKEEIKKIVKKYEKELGLEDEGHLDVGGFRPFSQLARVWGRDDLSLLGRLLGTASVPIGGVLGALLRYDHYNPFSETATVYNVSPDQFLGRHELGHLADFAGRRFKTPYQLAYGALPFFKLYPEYIASDVATKMFKKEHGLPKKAETELSDEERLARLRKYLNAAYGSYLGSEAKWLGLPYAALPGAWITRFMGKKVFPANNGLGEIKKRIKKQQERNERVGIIRKLIGI